jgi:hypothetical protein
MQEIAFDEWFEKYRPVKNPLERDSYYFETYGLSHDIVKDVIDSNRVWTWTEGDGVAQVQNGYHFVNRLYYYITEVPWQEDEIIIVPISEDERCQCYAEENYDKYEMGGEPDCSECEGYGNVTKYL